MASDSVVGVGDMKKQAAVAAVTELEQSIDTPQAADDAVWVRKWDDESGALFYFNLRTQESSWERPAEYKDVLTSEPLEAEEKEAQSAASVAIQSAFRGQAARKRVQEARKWTEQFDPASQQKYYYNSETGACQWEKPADFLAGARDERSQRAVKIQSVYRAKKARDRVKQLEQEEEEEEQQILLEQRQWEQEQQEEQVAEPLSERSPWSEFYDPRSGKYYYRNAVTDAITWEKPDQFLSSWTEGSQRDLAALSIQCVVRKRIATNDVDAKRKKLRALTDPAIIAQKLGELKQVSVEIQAEIDTRSLNSMEEEEQFPHLSSLITGWKEALERIKNSIISLGARSEDIQQAESVTERIVLAEHCHKSFAETRSECLALLRGILLMNSYFVDLDVVRINAACATVTKWRAHEVCALRDPHMLEIIQGSDISQLLENAEILLRRSMGLTDFKNGTVSAAGKRYEDWHSSVVPAVAAVRELEHRLTQTTALLRGLRVDEARKKELSQMHEEDLLAARIAQQERRSIIDQMDYAAFVKRCQECWQKGLARRSDDLNAIAAREQTEIQERTKRREMQHNEYVKEEEEASKAKLSIWETVKEGSPVEIVRAMVFAEMQKARRLGYDFLVKSARSDHGETLIQIACWWGHAHLVSFFLEEGGHLEGVDSNLNRFTLLHDAARRGHAKVVRILLERGLSCAVTDSVGDTPFHWAARKNHYGATIALLGVFMPNRDQTLTDEIIEAVCCRNHRGKTAFMIAKGDRVRHVLKLAEEGRLPPLRRPLSGDAKSVPGFSRRMTEVGKRERTRGSLDVKKGKTSTSLNKLTKHGSKLNIAVT